MPSSFTNLPALGPKQLDMYKESNSIEDFSSPT